MDGAGWEYGVESVGVCGGLEVVDQSVNAEASQISPGGFFVSDAGPRFEYAIATTGPPKRPLYKSGACLRGRSYTTTCRVTTCWIRRSTFAQSPPASPHPMRGMWITVSATSHLRGFVSS